MAKPKNSEDVRVILAEITCSQWVAIKFHNEKPQGIELSPPMAFCSAATRFIADSGLLKVATVPCGGLRYAFNSPEAKAPLMGAFVPSRLHTIINPELPVKEMPRLHFSPKYISFNLYNSCADIYLSMMLPESVAELAQVWASIIGGRFNLRLTGAMSFCSEGVAEAINTNSPVIAIGCAKAIRTAGLKGQLCVCLPGKLARKLVRRYLNKLEKVPV